MPRDTLNKADLLSAWQCAKRLHLRVHHPDLSSHKTSPAAHTGHVVGEFARLQFPGGVLIPRFIPGANPVQHTRELLADTGIPALFEAGFEAEGVRIFVDILVRVAGGWELIEVKSAGGVKRKHYDDVAVQAWVLQRAGVPIVSYHVMHINSDFEYAGNHDYNGLFIREDVTERVHAALPGIAPHVANVKAILHAPEPAVRMARQCGSQQKCEFYHHCAKSEPDYRLTDLPNIQQPKIDQLHAQGIFDLREIPASALTSANQLHVRAITIRGTPELDANAARELAPLGTPRYYVDFEAIQFAIPIWAGTHPYEQLPFQWSCHIEHADGTLEHREFLDTSGTDPRRAFALALVEACGTHGAIVVYNDNFEKGVISRLAQQFPDLRAPLHALNERVFDLLPVVKRNYYHPHMHGSWSIKDVLPCLVPELSYTALGSVQDGTQAQAVYLKIINHEGTEPERAQWREDLRRYCELDTLAMVRIAGRLVEERSQ